jgi:hypothetical protein
MKILIYQIDVSAELPFSGNHQIRYFLLVLSILLCFSVNGQNDKELGSWNGLGLKWEVNDKFSLFAESRLRAYAFYDNFYYYEITLRSNYILSNMFSVSVGTGKHITFPKEGNFIGPVELSEIRVYEEIIEKNSFSRFFIDNRIRVEQRFTSDGYKNRLRYRFGCSIPLNHATLIPKTIFMSFWDELFLVDKKSYLDLNRFFAGINYKIENVTFQTGFVNQISYDDSKKIRKNFFLVSLLFEIRRKKEK